MSIHNILHIYASDSLNTIESGQAYLSSVIYHLSAVKSNNVKWDTLNEDFSVYLHNYIDFFTYRLFIGFWLWHMGKDASIKHITIEKCLNPVRKLVLLGNVISFL